MYAPQMCTQESRSFVPARTFAKGGGPSELLAYTPQIAGTSIHCHYNDGGGDGGDTISLTTLTRYRNSYP